MKEYKKGLLLKLKLEKAKFNKRRDDIISSIIVLRSEQQNEDSEISIYNYNNELEYINEQLTRIENTINLIKNSRNIAQRKIGKNIEIGDSVTLLKADGMKTFYITSNIHYVDPANGLISAQSPLAEALLNHKFGAKVELSFGGQSVLCTLLP